MQISLYHPWPAYIATTNSKVRGRQAKVYDVKYEINTGKMVGHPFCLWLLGG
jgi:hypothetical protein